MTKQEFLNTFAARMAAALRDIDGGNTRHDETTSLRQLPGNAPVHKRPMVHAAADVHRAHTSTSLS